MAVFAFEDGKLVSAPAFLDEGHKVSEQVLNAIRADVLSLIDRPLFAVGWTTADKRDENQESLVALDPLGNIVTVEVVEELDARGLVRAAARAGRHADFNRRQLIDLSARNILDFNTDWNNFINASPPVTGKGPRLYLFIGFLAPDARDPLAALSGLGLEAQQVILHHGINGPLVEIVDVATLRAQVLRGARRPFTISHTSTDTVRTQPEEAMNMNENVDREDGVVDPQGAEQSWDIDPALWNIEGWNPNATMQIPRFTPPPVEPEPIILPSDQVDPLQQLIEEEIADKVPEQDAPVPLVRRDTAIMLAEMTPEIPEQVAATATATASAPTPAAVVEPASAPAPEPTSVPVPEPASAPDPEPSPGPRVSRRARRRQRQAEKRRTRMQRRAELRAQAAQEATPSIPVATPEPAPVSTPAPPPPPMPEQPVAKPLTWTNPADFLTEPIVPLREGRTLFDEVLDSTKRAEQLLWESSAPADTSEKMLISERASAEAAARAVAEAAEADARVFTGNHEIVEVVRNREIVRRNGGPVRLVWYSRRRGINLETTLDHEGYFVMADGARFTDPGAAATSYANIGEADPWRGWRTVDGRRLGDLR
ncbi:MAG: hypothetical protein GX483_02935 [Actinomycetaceae bacterium]|nr:hypothetical protein [Actinomycetaceae bacterium]